MPPFALECQKHTGSFDLCLRKRICRNKREIITLLLGKELNCNNTAAKHNEIYPHALLFFGCDPASDSSLITSAFPLTILLLPVLIKAKKGP